MAPTSAPALVKSTLSTILNNFFKYLFFNLSFVNVGTNKENGVQTLFCLSLSVKTVPVLIDLKKFSPSAGTVVIGLRSPSPAWRTTQGGRS